MTVPVLLVLLVVRVAVALSANWQAARFASAAAADIRRELASAFLHASWPVQQGEGAGRLQELLTTFAGAGAGLLSALTGAIVSGFSLAALLGLAIAVDPVGSIVAVVAVGVLANVLRPLRAAIKRQASRSAAAGVAFATSLNEVSQVGMEIHVHGVQSQTEKRVHDLIDENATIAERLLFLRGITPTVYTGLAYGVLVGAVGLLVAFDATDVSSLGAVLLIMTRSLAYGQAMQTQLAIIASSEPFVDELRKQVDFCRRNPRPDGTVDLDEINSVRLESVSFEYIPGQRALRDIDVEITAGEIIGIIGPSGSGKSTLLQLLLGLREPTDGRVLIDGHPLPTISRASWVRRVTFVPQKSRLLTGTITDNIRFFRDGVSQRDVEDAARLAHLHEEITDFPEGYERKLGERGGQLSGGQEQRLSIARALVEHPDMLILDEPTSSLDAASEALIRQTLAQLREKMIIVIVAHRLSTLNSCDRIMVVESGILSAFATPIELSAVSSFYRDAAAHAGAHGTIG